MAGADPERTERKSHLAAPTSATVRAVSLLRRHGAADIGHPGGTLLAHLERVQQQLATWGARPALQLRGRWGRGGRCRVRWRRTVRRSRAAGQDPG
ncbi:DUF6817 domain-containing protein [Streptomyces sp. TRM70350]|uniref:DUF6817 domain-containing protein n=1 Tax=Streptomyces sp. TRM70350 TaxID=2856165 RepID=UPI0035A8F97E